MQLVYPLDGQGPAPIEQVGGKGWSLITMTGQGLLVPPGFVLGTDFFRPWFEQIKAAPAWAGLAQAVGDDLTRRADALRQLALELQLSPEQHSALSAALDRLQAGGQHQLLAVRSSSPEEDLVGASFAGGYETVLGVSRRTIDAALRHCFASSLDARVWLYKREHGFPPDDPRLAVVVQAQIGAAKAGVAFSLNPINNCYDEAVVNANFGLGESVVDGRVTPDSFVLDKVKKSIVERKLGKKETSVWLAADGGTYLQPAENRGRLCLNDPELLALGEVISQVEQIYGQPMDIEWAMADDQLYLLQARPITTYVPLPQAMQTAPGEPKLLYLDETLSKQGIEEPLSVLGTDYLALFQSQAALAMSGQDTTGVVEGTGQFYQGRMYMNVSNTIKLSGKRKLLSTYRLIDASTAEIIAGIDGDEYVPRSLPERLQGAKLGTIRNSLGVGLQALRALRRPEEYLEEYRAAIQRYLSALQEIEGKQMALGDLARALTGEFMALFKAGFPTLVITALTTAWFDRAFRGADQETVSLLADLEKALPHNLTTEMGLALQRLSTFPEISESEAWEELRARLDSGACSPDFLTAWAEFLREYGARCPKELDAGTARYAERPEALYRLLRTVSAGNGTESNLASAFERGKAEREQSYRILLQRLERTDRRKSRGFKRNYQLLLMFKGYREAPKHFYVMTVAALRRRALVEAEHLVQVGRLDSPEQIFDLTIAQIEQARTDQSLDLRALAAENTAFTKQLQRVKRLPRVIDSRGRILHPPKRQAGPGELAGESISPGIVRGRVKVLHQPDQKPVLPGEILVAKATDPGWTPLFINAGGLVLEVGGMLQHGAVVAREYGKPCVSGVEDATLRLTDGQLVELDGAAGIVRLVENDLATGERPNK